MLSDDDLPRLGARLNDVHTRCLSRCHALSAQVVDACGGRTFGRVCDDVADASRGVDLLAAPEEDIVYFHLSSLLAASVNAYQVALQIILLSVPEIGIYLFQRNIPRIHPHLSQSKRMPPSHRLTSTMNTQFRLQYLLLWYKH